MIQSKIAQQPEIDLHMAFLIHLDFLNNPSQLGRWLILTDISDLLQLGEGLLDQLFQLLPRSPD